MLLQAARKSGPLVNLSGSRRVMSPTVAEAVASEEGSMETPPSEEKAANHQLELGGELVPVGKTCGAGTTYANEFNGRGTRKARGGEAILVR